MRVAPAILAIAVFGGAAGSATAQGVTKRPQPPAPQTVEIRGEVPTPQVVTVRPRQIPDYSRGILVPSLYDRHFWPAILAPYRIVPPLPSDATHRPPGVAEDSVMMSDSVTGPRPGAPAPPPAASTAVPTATPNAPRER
jgi:hypothetical protein